MGRISQTVVSPAGDRVVYCWNGDRYDDNLDLYVRDLRAGTTRRLTSHPANEHSAAWSPDGSLIAFLRNGEGVFITTSDGQKQWPVERAHSGAIYGVGMSWSPNGRWLVYSEKDSDAAPAVLYLLPVTGGARRALAQSRDRGLGDMYPSFSPNGSWIAFVHNWSNSASDIYLQRISDRGEAAGDPRRLTTDGHWIAGLDWTRDGSGIVYSSDRSGPRRLWLLKMARIGQPESELIAAVGDHVWQPTLARRGQAMVYSRRYWTTGIWRVALEFGRIARAPERLIASNRVDRDPVYSPDGSRIAFISDRSGFTELWVTDSNGDDEKQLTSFRRLWLNSPDWSPDGGFIVFSISGTGIYTVPAAGGAASRVTPSSFLCDEPSWSSDGRAIYCSSSSGGGAQVWRMPARSGSPVAVTDGKRPRESPDGAWLYVIRGGALWRVPTRGGSAECVIAAPVGSFALTDNAIYFDQGSGDYTRAVIKYHDLGTGRTKLLAELPSRKSGGLGISPDGRTLLVPLNERQGSELLFLPQLGEFR
jgi:Tol biopolymer transport system component